jgi:hypothetical protein
MAGGYDPETNTVVILPILRPFRLGRLEDQGRALVITCTPPPFYRSTLTASSRGFTRKYRTTPDSDALLASSDDRTRGKATRVHPNKGGFVSFDRAGKPQNVWRLIKNINFVQDIADGTLVGRATWRKASTRTSVRYRRGVSWNMGSYNPKTGLFYKVGNEWCMDLEVVKTTPVLEPMAQLNIGANFNLVNPDGDKARGHVDARDPITGKLKWQIDFPEPRLARLLSTGGNLLFVPDARGVLHAYDAGTGRNLEPQQRSRHNGGIISYMAKAHIAVATGWGGLADDYASFFAAFAQMPKDSGVPKICRAIVPSFSGMKLTEGTQQDISSSPLRPTSGGRRLVRCFDVVGDRVACSIGE